MVRILRMRDCSGTEHQEEFEGDIGDIEDIVEEWVIDCDAVGPEGGVVSVSWDLVRVEEEEEVEVEIDSGKITVSVPPDEEELIRRIDPRGKLCGCSPEDHSWSSEGEGGLDQNPGVWSVGGTGLLVRDHCDECGLRREWYYPGVQALPGECDSVTYSMGDEE